jgi:hypothetical protein
MHSTALYSAFRESSTSTPPIMVDATQITHPSPIAMISTPSRSNRSLRKGGGRLAYCTVSLGTCTLLACCHHVSVQLQLGTYRRIGTTASWRARRVATLTTPFVGFIFCPSDDDEKGRVFTCDGAVLVMAARDDRCVFPSMPEL